MDLADSFNLYAFDLSQRATCTHVHRVRAALSRFERSVRDGELDLTAVLAWRASRLADGVSRETANKEFGYIRSALRWAMTLGAITRDPSVGLRRLPVREGDRRRLRRPMSREELARFLSALSVIDGLRGGIPQRPTFLFCVATGMRRGEACALTWGDWRTSEREVHVPAFITKAKRSRILPVVESVACELAALRVAQERVTSRRIGPNDPILLARRGSPWARSPDNLGRLFRAALTRAGILHHDRNNRGLSMHALRHTFLTEARRAGVSPRVAQELAGHADVETTLGFYDHVDPADLRVGVEAIHRGVVS